MVFSGAYNESLSFLWVVGLNWPHPRELGKHYNKSGQSKSVEKSLKFQIFRSTIVILVIEKVLNSNGDPTASAANRPGKQLWVKKICPSKLLQYLFSGWSCTLLDHQQHHAVFLPLRLGKRSVCFSSCPAAWQSTRMLRCKNFPRQYRPVFLLSVQLCCDTTCVRVFCSDLATDSKYLCSERERVVITARKRGSSTPGVPP